MKKFYIPTSTLNFNNILSSESISPKAFYDKRGFGYSRWATIPENPFDNAIVLFDNICIFERPKSDLEDHPLLIEVLWDEAQLKQLEGYWYCDYTLFLAPTTTRFLFFSETDKRITLSMSESSLETKLFLLYAKQIQTIQKPAEWYPPISSNEPCELNKPEIKKDVRINKMKGMLYGYYIGSLLSLDLNSIKKLNVFREIFNIFAAILSSFEKRPTAYQNERLDLLFDYINEQNADFRNLYNIINSSSMDSMHKAKTIWSWVCNRREYFQTEEKSIWLSCLQSASDKDEKENQAITWIKSKIENTQKQARTKGQILSPDKEEIIVVDRNLSVLKNSNLIGETDRHLCISWLNETLSEKNTNGRISTYKEELAQNLTFKAKEVFQNMWEGSQTRIYLNDLRRHIAGEEFKHKWNNGLLSSIAAVVIAGDDWEKLLAFMQNKEMTDYKLAYAFYGTLNGYANLPRDFTDVLYGQDKKYVWNVYKEFYGQLIGEDIPERVGDDSHMSPDYEYNMRNDSTNAKNVEKVCLREKVKAIIKANPRRQLSEKDKLIIERALDKTCDEVAFINMIGNEIENLNKGIFPCLQKDLYPDWKQRRTKQHSNKRNNDSKEMNDFWGYLFDDNSKQVEQKAAKEVATRSIINDLQASGVLGNCSFLPVDIKRQVVSLFKDFQKSYQTGYYYERKDQYKRNNSDVIDHFIRWCLSPKNKSALKWSPENSTLMDKLKTYLMNVYGD